MKQALVLFLIILALIPVVKAEEKSWYEIDGIKLRVGYTSQEDVLGFSNEENIIEREPWFKEGWEIVWYDEFDSTSLDMNKWSYEVGGHGFGNNELQFYTNDTSNVFTKEGVLHIRAKFEAAGIGESTNLRNFSSARLRTLGKGDWKYVRIDVKAKLALGQGIWPAIWMLPTDWTYGNWPKSGEIDIMEHVNLENRFLGTVHSESQHGSNGVGGEIEVQGLNENFHDYSLEWDSDQMSFAFNDSIFFTLNKADYTDDEEHWPFDQPFFLILNLAVGGNWPGSPNSSTEFPSKFFINYVRVYEKVSS